MDFPPTPSQYSVKVVNTFLQGKGQPRQGPSLRNKLHSLEFAVLRPNEIFLVMKVLAHCNIRSLQKLILISIRSHRRRRVILLRVTRTFTTFRVTGTNSLLSLVRLGVHLMGCQLDNLRRDFCSVCCPCLMVDPMFLMSTKPDTQHPSSSNVQVR